MEKTNFFWYDDNMKEYKETSHNLIDKSMSDMALYSAGYEECSAGYGYGPLFRSYHIIHFVLSGKGALHINQQTFQCRKGDAFIIPAGKVSFYQASETEPWTYAWINFLGINAERYVYELMTAAGDGYVLHGLDTEKYKNCILEILSIFDNNISSYFYVNSVLLRVMSYLYEDVGVQEKSWGKISLADEIRFYLDMKYPQKIQLQEVAAKFNIHPNYMTRIFRDKFQISPKRYLMELKLKKAGHLLATTGLPVTVISDSLGFEDPLAFSKTFKKWCGKSPTAYRKDRADLEPAE